MHFFTPNHVQLLNSCYPPPSALFTAGPDYLPNSQELSRLTYYASNHPGKLTKLGSELEKRVKAESRKAKAGNQRSKVSLLMTLSVFRALSTECRRDVALLAPSLMSSVKETLDAVPTDLEVVVRAASLFTAWTTYTDGHLIGTDSNTNSDYLAVLHHFSLLSCSTATDQEVRNRTRLIGFAALAGASNSDALCHDSCEFSAQVSRIMPPILTTLFQTDVSALDEQAAAVKDEPWSPYLAEFRTRPAIERRAASIHIHIPGDKGPSMEDVSNAALQALLSLVEHANGGQIGLIMKASFNSLDDSQTWGQLHHCCWLAKKMVEWSQYQYRFAVPTWLVERLSKSEETLPLVSPVHTALAAMATTVFNSPAALVNLSTSDMMSTLTTVLLRRVESDKNDLLIPAIIECISSLGRHVYYSDQIQDLSGELINRLTVVEAQGALSQGKPSSEKNTTDSIRFLLASLMGLIQAANKGQTIEEGRPSHPLLIETGRKGSISSSLRVSRRSAVPTEMWQETLSLLCDHDYAVRADYFDILVFYIKEEMPKLGTSMDSNHVKHARRLSGGPIQQALNLNILLHPGNSGTKFLHAIHAYLYTLATSSSLGLISSSPTSPSRSTLDEPIQLNVIPPVVEDRGERAFAPSPSSTNGRRSFSATHPAIRKASVVKRVLDRAPSRLSTFTSSSACLADYTLILNVLTALHEELPVRALLAGIPMLLALDRATKNVDPNEVMLQRITVIKEILAKTWLALGKIWNSSELAELAQTALSSGPNSLPSIPSAFLSPQLPIRNVVDFSEVPAAGTTWAGVNANEALLALTKCPTLYEATGFDQQTLMRKLSIKWTADYALGESMERASTFESTVRGDGLTPLLKISPALMHIENISQQSLARSARGVGVADLRGALDGRSSMSNPNLGRPPSLSTLEHAPSTHDGGFLRLTQTRSRGKKRLTPTGAGEVRDVLHKLGIGKQNGSLLKASFPPFNQK